MTIKPIKFIQLIILINLSNSLICPPDHFMPNDNYWNALDYTDQDEKYYGFAFSYSLKETYYDRWYGIPFIAKSFCKYSDYSLFVSNIWSTNLRYQTDTSIANYVLINKSNTNYYNLYKYHCHYKTIYFFMDEYLSDFNNYYYLYFRVVNIYNTALSFKFQLYGEYNGGYTTFDITNILTLSAHSAKLYIIPFKLGEKDAQNRFKIITERSRSSGVYYYQDKNSKGGSRMEIILFNFDGSNFVGVSSYQLMYRRKSDKYLTYLGSEGCDNNEECMEGYTCNNKKCVRCNSYSCKGCSNNSATAICTKCFSVSPVSQWLGSGKSGCDLDYVDLTKFEIQWDKKNGQVPPAIHWKVTMDYWIWINYPLNLKKHLDIIYTDFMTISMDKTNQEDGIDIFCVPIEWLYNFSKADNYELTASQYINDILGAFHMKDSKIKIASKWIYVRCGFDLRRSKMYLNDLSEVSLEIPQMYSLSNVKQNNFPFHMKKFYKYDDFLEIKLKNFQNVSKISETFIYMRNLNLFREYIPQKIQTKYWTFSDTLNLHHFFPQLLYSIPFKAKWVNNAKYTFSTFNYYDRKQDGTVNDNYVEISTNSLNLVGSFSSIAEPYRNLHPIRNFQRLNFNSLTKNTLQEAITCDQETFQNIKCDITGSQYCFDDNKPLLCKTNETTDYPFMLDINKLVCNKYCPEGYMHPPRDANNGVLQGLYCSEKCPDDSYCPSQRDVYQNIEQFTCNLLNFYELYYNCYEINNAINLNSGGLLFSSNLKSKTIILDLKNTYESYAISAWIYADKRVKYLLDNPENYLKTIENYSIFLMDNFQIKYNETELIKNGSKLLNEKYNNIDKFDLNNWNHFFFAWEKMFSNKGYRLHITFQNKIYSRDSNIYNTTFRPLTKIVFCNEDKTDFSSINFGKVCEYTKWLDSFYRDIRIFNILESNLFAAFMNHQYAFGVNNLMKHHFINKLQ